MLEKIMREPSLAALLLSFQAHESPSSALLLAVVTLIRRLPMAGAHKTRLTKG